MNSIDRIECLPNELLVKIAEWANNYSAIRLVDHRFKCIVDICFTHLNNQIVKQFPYFIVSSNEPITVLKSLIRHINEEEIFYWVQKGKLKPRSLDNAHRLLSKSLIRLIEKRNELQNDDNYAFVNSINKRENPATTWDAADSRSKREVNKKWNQLKKNNKTTSLLITQPIFYFCPNHLFDLTQLTQLHIVYVPKLRAIPDEISRLKALDELKIERCGELKIIPYLKLKFLTRLILRSIDSRVLNDSIVKLTNLTLLVLSHNRMSKVPDCIGQVTSLLFLEMSNNYLADLPSSFSMLKNLRDLDVSGNEMSEFPPVILQLGTLRRLDISTNQIKVLPNNLIQLMELKYLSIKGNRIRRLPQGIQNLAQKKAIELEEGSQVLSPWNQLDCPLC